MDRIADWRPIETSGPGGSAAGSQHAAANEQPGHWRLLVIGVLGCLGIGAGAVMLWAGSPRPELVLTGMSDPSPTAAAADGSPLALASPAAAVPATIVVDVEGAVAAPGIYTLATDSRVGDAIAAAGGYSPAVDIEAAAQLLNLAARLSDGEKVLVPRLGAQSLETPGGWAAPVGSATPTGLIDINLADQPALEMLPGVGPVTAAKIIAARNEAPFTSVDELLSRGVLGPATFEKVRPLVTVGQ